MNMNEFGITKIIDALFIADLSLMQDYEFLVGNKVSHIVVWTDSSNQIYFDQPEIKMLKLQRHGPDGLLPETNQLIKVYEFVQESRDQLLCCIICSDFQSQAAMLLATYIIKKYCWDLETVFRYIGLRFNHFNPRVQIVQQLQDFQLYLQIHQSNIKPKTIYFTYQFLHAYQTDDYQEKFLINTIKNTTLDKLKCFQQKKNLSKRRKRVQWFDKIRPSSSTATFNSKFTIYNRNSSLKQKNKLHQNQSIKQNIQTLAQSMKPPKGQRKNSQVVNFGQFFMDGLEYESLKELTRCKIIDNGMKGSIRKSSSFRMIRTENMNKVHRQSDVQKIYNKDTTNVNKKEQKNILRTLKSLSKMKLGLSA